MPEFCCNVLDALKAEGGGVRQNGCRIHMFVTSVAGDRSERTIADDVVNFISRAGGKVELGQVDENALVLLGSA